MQQPPQGISKSAWPAAQTPPITSVRWRISLNSAIAEPQRPPPSRPMRNIGPVELAADLVAAGILLAADPRGGQVVLGRGRTRRRQHFAASAVGPAGAKVEGTNARSLTADRAETDGGPHQRGGNDGLGVHATPHFPRMDPRTEPVQAMQRGNLFFG